MLDPIIGDFCLPQALMDGGSGVNIIFPNTLSWMGISKSCLSPAPTGFHGFVPGMMVQPLGQIYLKVILGGEENFNSETMCFEVALFCTVYIAIFGRPAYVKYMLLPSYAYLQQKMLGSNGIITIHGSAERALKVEVVNVELTEAALASMELEEIDPMGRHCSG